MNISHRGKEGVKVTGVCVVGSLLLHPSLFSYLYHWSQSLTSPVYLTPNITLYLTRFVTPGLSPDVPAYHRPEIIFILFSF